MLFEEPVDRVVCACDACKITVHVIEAPRPQVCPWCHARLQYASSKVLIRSLSEFSAQESDKPRNSMFKRPQKWVIALIVAACVLLLSVAIYYQVVSFEHYWYDPLVNFYSLLAGVFIVSRFVFAAFYSPPPDVGYEPDVAICVPCHNEGDEIDKTIRRIFAAGYPERKLEVIAVNDASTDNSLQELLKMQAYYPLMIVVDFAVNRGLSQGMTVATLLAHGEIMVYVDSDTFILPGSIRKIVQGLADPRVAGVSGHTDVENCDTNILTKMQDVRYYVSFAVMKAAESVFGAVSCLPGCFSAYRKVCVLHALEPWLHQKFLGKYGTYADDRSLTNCILRNYRVLYDSEALATTIAPDKWNKYIRQQARWTRSWVREILTGAGFMWRKHPVPSISWYIMMILPIFEPPVMFWALVVAPFFFGQMVTSYLLGVFLITVIWSLYFYERTGRPYWWTGIVFTISYALFFSWQVYYAICSVRYAKWGTR